MASTSFLQTFHPLGKIKPNSGSSRRPGLIRVRAMKGEGRNHGSKVDENMIVLRKRIHEMKVMEGDGELPREWMEWERRVYVGYDAIICDAVGHLQSYLMDTRPSFALAMLVILALGMPTSTALVLYNLMAVVSGIHSD
ncbi:uncharacterized protein LOC121752582 [Salvia splendens]|nr:uncharacterized protein LOC121752582 [Salvia splendens]